MKAYGKVISAMIIFGSMGIFVRKIPLPSNEIVLGRTVIGGLFLLVVQLLLRQKMSRAAIRRQWSLLAASGFALGFNWVFLFESYRYTTVSAATMAYYCAPVFVILLSLVVFRERIGFSKILGILAAMGGMLLMNSSGFGDGAADPLRGLVFGLLAAVLYALFVILNKQITGMTPLETTITQLFIAAVVDGVYVLLTHQPGAGSILAGGGLVALLVICIVHTGLACYLFFSAMRELPGQTIAALSYIDPLSALVFSAIFLNERLSVIQLAGAALVLSGAAVSELVRKPTRSAG